MTVSKGKAVVLLSGGLDSATALAWARSQGFELYALSIHYGQRHQAELAAAKLIAKQQGAIEHLQMDIGLNRIGGSALTDHALPIPEEIVSGIPSTYVPARNTVFLALALGWSEVVGANTIVIGVNAVDYSGYPDCRPEFIQAFQALARVATRAAVETDAQIRIETPLLHLDKSAIIQMGKGLGVDYSMTVSCYQANDDGKACGRCNSCEIRRKGFESAGIPDPTRYC